MSLSRRAFLGSLAAARLAFGLARKPNVIVIVSDDHGYNEIGLQGGDIPTPNIDSIGKNGVRFSNGYVSCPVCSPTRAGIMTGRYQQRFGHEFNPGPPAQAQENFGLPLTEKTFANHMKELGYATGMVGKWHLGYKPEYHPMKRGFDEYFGFLGGAHSYIDSQADNANSILKGTEPVEEKEYLTDAFTREATAFVDRHRGEPFFLYLAFNAVHAPLQGAEKYLDRFANMADQKRRTFAAMLSALDDGVGKVLAKIREHKLEGDTLILFVGDNGGPTPQTTSRNNPLRGYKAQAWEGGIRVPFLAQWPGKLPKGKIYENPVIALDFLPTAVAAGGGKPPSGLDGVDLLPYVTGKNNAAPHDALYWRFGLQRAIRKGDWKLVQAATDSWELYNLREDISESKNLASSQPERAKELLAAYEAWNSQLAEPRWNNRRANLRRADGPAPAKRRRARP